MKVSDLKPGEIEKEMKKNLRVRALGDTAEYVGYYNLLRRRGGDIFVLKPIIRDKQVYVRTDVHPVTKQENKVFKTVRMLITAEQQFSSKWMEKVKANLPETPPQHFNKAGRGRRRMEIPGMTSRVGGEDDNVLYDNENQTEVQTEEVVTENPQNEESVI